jgi:hypothetical protein
MILRGLVVRVAEYLGIAEYDSDGRAIAPESDAHDLDLCKRLVNDGIRQFIRANPKWYWMQRVFSLTITNAASELQVGGDAARYAMPYDFNGDAQGDWTFGQGQNVLPHIQTVDEAMIRNWRSTGANESGVPRFAAFRRLSDADVPEGVRSRWEVVFYPAPGQSYVLELDYRHYFNALDELDADAQPAGAEHDDAILYSALARAELHRDDVRGAMHEAYRESLADSVRLDLKAAPKTVGPNLDASGRGYITNRRQLGYARPVNTPTYGS